MYETYVIEYLTHNDYDIEVSDLYPVGNLIASENKMKTLQQAALTYVVRGDTSVEEISRVL